MSRRSISGSTSGGSGSWPRLPSLLGQRVTEFGWHRVLLAGDKPVIDGFADRATGYGVRAGYRRRQR
jgi:hypothetical protein